MHIPQKHTQYFLAKKKKKSTPHALAITTWQNLTVQEMKSVIKMGKEDNKSTDDPQGHCKIFFPMQIKILYALFCVRKRKCMHVCMGDDKQWLLTGQSSPEMHLVAS